MNLLSSPKRIETSDVVFVAIVSVVALLFVPRSVLDTMNVDWMFGLFLLPVSFLAGLFSYWIFYRSHDLATIDPFYIRSWWSVIGGFVALPICLIARPEVAHLAFICLTFGTGPVVAFHIYRRRKNEEA